MPQDAKKEKCNVLKELNIDGRWGEVDQRKSGKLIKGYRLWKHVNKYLIL